MIKRETFATFSHTDLRHKDFSEQAIINSCENIKLPLYGELFSSPKTRFEKTNSEKEFLKIEQPIIKITKVQPEKSGYLVEYEIFESDVTKSLHDVVLVPRVITLPKFDKIELITFDLRIG